MKWKGWPNSGKVWRSQFICFLPAPFQTPAGLAPGVSSFLQMAVSFTYRYLALFTDTGYIWMGTASLKVWFWNSKGYCAVSKEELLWIGSWLFNIRMTVEQQDAGTGR